jgi:hypothetical protein
MSLPTALLQPAPLLLPGRCLLPRALRLPLLPCLLLAVFLLRRSRLVSLLSALSLRLPVPLRLLPLLLVLLRPLCLLLLRRFSDLWLGLPSRWRLLLRPLLRLPLLRSFSNLLLLLLFLPAYLPPLGLFPLRPVRFFAPFSMLRRSGDKCSEQKDQECGAGNSNVSQGNRLR